jgi:hypothetical protein
VRERTFQLILADRNRMVRSMGSETKQWDFTSAATLNALKALADHGQVGAILVKGAFYTSDLPYLWGRTIGEGHVIFGAGLVFGGPSDSKEPTFTKATPALCSTDCKIDCANSIQRCGDAVRCGFGGANSLRRGFDYAARPDTRRVAYPAKDRQLSSMIVIRRKRLLVRR